MINRTQEWKDEGRRLRKANIEHCRHCHSKKNVLKDFTYKGIARYTCRKCNTLRAKKYRSTEKGKITIYKAVYKSIKLHQDKQDARLKLNLFLRKGIVLKKDVCEVCLKHKKLSAHHHDYTRPLDVKWLCSDCHCKEHKKI